MQIEKNRTVLYLYFMINQRDDAAATEFISDNHPDLLLHFEAMTPAEYRNGGESLHIQYYFLHTIFGDACIARTSRGICHLAFEEEKRKAIDNLKSRFPNATFEEENHHTFQEAAGMINCVMPTKPLPLHVHGSNFQLKIWQALLNIPFGNVTSYGRLANELGIDKASRAVGTAIGKNNIASLIPCHRVIQANGSLGGYRWGLRRKKTMLAHEAINIPLEEKQFQKSINHLEILPKEKEF